MLENCRTTGRLLQTTDYRHRWIPQTPLWASDFTKSSCKATDQRSKELVNYRSASLWNRTRTLGEASNEGLELAVMLIFPLAASGRLVADPTIQQNLLCRSANLRRLSRTCRLCIMSLLCYGSTARPRVSVESHIRNFSFTPRSVFHAFTLCTISSRAADA